MMEIRIKYINSAGFHADMGIELDLEPEEQERVADAVQQAVSDEMPWDPEEETEPWDAEEEEDQAPVGFDEVPEEEPEEEPEKEALPAERMTFEKPGYTGLLLVECDDCGAHFVTYSRKKRAEVECNCGRSVPLENMREVIFRCPACGEERRMKTNATTPTVEAYCYKCKVKMTASWKKKLRRYES